MGGAYATTLERIRGQDGDKGKLGIEVLMWVSRSERPLLAEELCHALAIEADSTELDARNVPAIGTLLSCCLGLVTVDEEGSRVRLIHLTLQEYLTGHPDLFGGAHSKIAEACLTYLNFQSIKDLPPTLLAPPPQTPFLEYASCYWGDHARKELSERTKSLALQLLDQYDHHVSAKLLLFNMTVRLSNAFFPYLRRKYERLPTRFTGLHAIAFFGLAEVAMALLKSRDWAVDRRDRVYTAFMGCKKEERRGL